MKKRVTPHILKAAVFGANDGIVTTFAVVAGVAGANLSSRIVLIMGFANLFADGIAMGLGDYLGEKSEHEMEVLSGKKKMPKGLWHTGAATFIAFAIAGVAPLIPYILTINDPVAADLLDWSLICTAIALFTTGSLRSIVTKRNWIRGGFEMLAVGLMAAGVAYAIGALVDDFA